jgi:hypothetical protein
MPAEANIGAISRVMIGVMHAPSRDDTHTLDLDSHAQQAVVGKDCYVISDAGEEVDVFGYDTTLGSVRCRIVSACFAYDDPNTGQAVLLVIHQGIHVPHLQCSLIPPAQLRCNDVCVRECPKSMMDTPSALDHTLQIPREDGSSPYVIHLELRGIISYLPVRKPTSGELQDMDLLRLELTYETPTWNPDSPYFARSESSLRHHAISRQATGDELDTLLPPKQRNTLISGVTFRDIMAMAYSLASQSSAILAELSNTLSADTLYEALCDSRIVSSVRALPHSTAITAEGLAKRWMISLEKARQTIDATSQRMIRERPADLVRRFKTNDRLLRYNRINATMFTDTLFAGVVSRRMNKCAQVFTIPEIKWVACMGLRTKGDAHLALDNVFRTTGAPSTIVCDGSKEQTLGKFRLKCRDAGTTIHPIEPYSPWSNLAEGCIRELKKKSRRRMCALKVPKRLWDDCIEFEADIMSHTAHDSYELHGQVPQAIVSGQPVDISRLAEFAFYDWVYWYDESIQYPGEKKTLGRYLGPSRDIGSAMCAKILKKNAQMRTCSTYIAVSHDEMQKPNVAQDMKEFNESINSRLGESATLEDFPDDETPEYERYEDDMEPPIDAVDRDDFDEDAFDPYLNAQVLLPIQGEQSTGTVLRRKRDSGGNLIGKAHKHPILDTRLYVVQFPDGKEAEYAANVIAESMIAQCDTEGRQHLLLKAIVDHEKLNSAVPKSDGFITVRGRKSRKKTTKGWRLCVEWKDGTTSWEALSILKEHNPVEIAEYAVAHGIDDEPAFAWWVPFTLKKRDSIISAVNKRYWKRTHKFGIRIPHSVEEALRIDKENGDSLWQDAIQKEMTNVMVAFKFLGKGVEPPPGYQKIKCHMIFDVKLDGFKRKAREVADGHLTDPPATLTYASVVSRDTVRIALTMAALHDIEVKTADIQNAYLTAPCTEKVAVVCGPEFGIRQGETALVVRALYGLKSSGAAFRNHLASCMKHLGYKQCPADADLWMKPMVRPEDGFKYYAYVLLYVDDALVIHHDGMAALREIDYYFRMKPESMGNPDLYLGCKLRKFTMPNGVEAWVNSPSKYIQEAVKNVEEHIQKRYNATLPKKVTSPCPRDYRPELDISPVLDAEDSSYYQSQIGVLRWMVELGRVDIITEVSLLASQLAMPREGHLDAVFNIFGYLKIHHNYMLAFDPTYPEIDGRFNDGTDWKSFYGDVKEPMPPNMPEPRGKELIVRLFVDSDHAGDKLIRRSRTGFIVYLNMAPIIWYSKRQGTIESSVFGAEFVAMKVGIETVRGLRYKCRMMGIRIDEPTYIYGDNMSVVHNTSKPESTLKKKSSSICYHFVRESVAMGESLVGHIRSEENPADICTKIIPGGMKRQALVEMILHTAADGFEFGK